MRTAALSLTAAVLVASPLVAAAQAPPAELRDLVGARAPGAETALATRGFVNVGSEAGDDRRWTYWWHERRGLCLSVTTRNGRIDAITPSPAPDCRRPRPTTLPGPVGPPIPPRPTTLPGPTGGPVASGRTEEIRFERGASSATRRGVIRGYETVTYTLDLRAGQVLGVSLQSSNTSGYFNLTAPGGREALFNSAMGVNRYQGRAAVNGRYRIEVYLMRNAARRGEMARYTLDVSARR